MGPSRVADKTPWRERPSELWPTGVCGEEESSGLQRSRPSPASADDAAAAAVQFIGSSMINRSRVPTLPLLMLVRYVQKVPYPYRIHVGYMSEAERTEAEDGEKTERE